MPQPTTSVSASARPRIRNLEVRRFRSIERATLSNCGGLNVLIGKNNSGKSNLLATIDLVHRHLWGGSIAGPWSASRPTEEFTDRDTRSPLQIGIEFDLLPDLNQMLRERLKVEVPHLEKSIEQLKTVDRVSMIVAGVLNQGGSFLFLQRIVAGPLKPVGADLTGDGMSLLDVSTQTARELFAFRQESHQHRSDLKVLDRLLEDPSRFDYLTENREGRYYWEAVLGPEVRPQLLRNLTQIGQSASSAEELRTRVNALAADLRAKSELLEHRETDTPLGTFAGTMKTAPAYALWLMKEYASQPMLHLRETRDRIGREEAEALLALKVTRGGPERLRAVQHTVKSLLGVEIDAFQSEDRRGPGRGAEMDIDQFLVEANGAGIREALRLLLDLQLKKPALLLLEEPEVHLHPGLEHAVYGHLRDQSEQVQMFVTTHSTNFVDSVSFQNIYLVSRDERGRTQCEQIDQGDEARVPAELGLRLSTVFMYDRLVFVEGASDEAVLRELAKTLETDLASANVGFVQIGGVRNFAHYAAEATIELLARRQVQVWFVVDRDERNDEEVRAMEARVGARARLVVLQRRELENYLMDASAVARLVEDKMRSSGTEKPAPTEADVEAALEEVAREMKDEVLELRRSSMLLRPVFLNTRSQDGDVRARLEKGIEQLRERVEGLESVGQTIREEMEADWDVVALDRAPGALVLDAVAKRYGVRFRKENGDGARLARYVRKDSIPEELKLLLTELARR